MTTPMTYPEFRLLLTTSSVYHGKNGKIQFLLFQTSNPEVWQACYHVKIFPEEFYGTKDQCLYQTYAWYLEDCGA